MTSEKMVDFTGTSVDLSASSDENTSVCYSEKGRTVV